MGFKEITEIWNSENKEKIYSLEDATKNFEFLRKFKKVIPFFCWSQMSKVKNLSEAFMREFHEKLDFYFIAEYQKLSEEFMRDFQDRLFWSNVCKYQELNESFIEEMSERIDWHWVSIKQKLSESFLEKHEKDVYWLAIFKYQAISEKFIEKLSLPRSIPWSYIFENSNINLSSSFLAKHKDSIPQQFFERFKRKCLHKNLKELESSFK